MELTEIEFAVVDLETTGWTPEAAAITEIGAVRVRDGRRQGEFASLVNPGTAVPPSIEDLTGITDWMLASAPRVASCAPHATTAGWPGPPSPCWTPSCWPGR